MVCPGCPGCQGELPTSAAPTPNQIRQLVHKRSQTTRCPLCLNPSSNLIGLLEFLLLSCGSTLCILDPNPLCNVPVMSIFFYSVICIFTFFMVSFKEQKSLTLIWSNISILSFTIQALCVLYKKFKIIPTSPISSSRSCIVFGSFWVRFCICWKVTVNVLLLLFLIGKSSCSNTIYWNSITFLLSFPGVFIGSQLTVYGWTYLYTLRLALLISLCNFTNTDTKTNYLDYWSFIVSFEVAYSKPSNPCVYAATASTFQPPDISIWILESAGQFL